ncbi:MAG: ABC transporter ATP-binding protein [Chloroflexota bacterium]
MPVPALATHDLTKRFGAVTAIEHLDIAIAPGEVFGFLGPNGSGKTTTVKLVLGLLDPTEGSIELFGEDAQGNRHELLRRVSAIVESPAFYPYLSASENLKVLATIDDFDDSEIEEAIHRVGLEDVGKRHFQDFSVGMKQRLGIAAAILRRPDLVILDEPTSGLDPAGQREIRDLIPELARAGAAVFLSSHMMHEVQEICDRVGILSQGRLISVGSVSDLVVEQGVIQLRIEPADRALEVVRSLDWVERAEIHDGLLAIAAPLDRSAELNQVLAGEGLFASEIRPLQRNLEDVFLEITGERKSE